MNRTDFIDQPSLRDDVPDFSPGDTLKVHVKVIEGARERVQVFQGAVIRRQGSGARETFTVRKVSFGVGVERTFPVHSPVLDKIEVVSRGQVRRAKLYYLRDRIGKAAKIKEKRTPRPEGKKGKSAAKVEKPATAEVRPDTESPDTESPVTESPVTESPVTESPVTESPDTGTEVVSEQTSTGDSGS